MAAAEVGDDVLDRDPTMRELEERVAGLLGADGRAVDPERVDGQPHRADAPPRPRRRVPRPGRRARAGQRARHGGLARRRHAAAAASTTPGRARSPRTRCAGRRRAATGRTTRCAPRCSAWRTPTTRPAARSPRPRSTPPSPRRPGQRSCGCTSTAPGSGTPRWRSACRPAALTVGADTVQVCLSKGLGAPVGFGGRRLGRVRRGRPAAAQDARRRGAPGRRAGRGRRWSRWTASTGSPRTTSGPRALADRAARARLAGLGAADQHRAASRSPTWPARCAASRRRGCAAAPMAGQVRLMTHADLTDADITAALERIGPVDGTHGRDARTGAAHRFARPPLSATGCCVPARPAGR